MGVSLTLSTQYADLDGYSYTKQTISDLLQNKVDMSQLVITKALSKTGQSKYDLLLHHIIIT